jgi:ferredoxin-NADP reductase
VADLSQELSLELIDRQLICQDVVLLTLAHPERVDLPRWAPGAHIDVESSNGLTRQYSLCGDPADLTRWQVAVLRTPDSRGGSTWVHDVMSAGDLVKIRGPRNHFQMQPASEYLLIAGGIGITPLLPMVRALQGAGANWRLVYGGRSRESMAFADELVDEFPDRVAIYPQDELGVLPLRDILAPHPSGTAIYSCGPEGMLKACEELADSWPAGSLHIERFTSQAITAGTPSTVFEVELASSGDVLTIPADRSILSVLIDAGVDIDWSCGEGTCGTCETFVLDGVPDHRDLVLTAEERAEGASMFVCVSRANSPRLVLDL